MDIGQRLTTLDAVWRTKEGEVVSAMVDAEGLSFLCPECQQTASKHYFLVWFDGESCCEAQVERPATGYSLDTLTLLGEPISRPGDCSMLLRITNGWVSVLR